MTAGLLVLRLVVGGFLFGHGAQKLFGWFGGRGPRETAQGFERLGYHPALVMARLAGASETTGGLLLGSGLATPLAAAIVVGVMANAVGSAHRGKGPWATNGGWELPVTYAVVAVCVASIGAGRASLDAAIGWDVDGVWWACGAVLLGATAAGMVLRARRTEAHARIA
jgi:putative oxidoreductase